MRIVYQQFLALYPRAFQTEFGEEMVAVYSEALADSRRAGRYACARFYVREFAGLVVGAVTQHLSSPTPDSFSLERIFSMRNGFRYSRVAIGFMAISFVVVLMAMTEAAAIAAGYSHVPVINLVRPFAVCCGIAVIAGIVGWLIALASGRSGSERLSQVETWQKSA